MYPQLQPTNSVYSNNAQGYYPGYNAQPAYGTAQPYTGYASYAQQPSTYAAPVASDPYAFMNAAQGAYMQPPQPQAAADMFIPPNYAQPTAPAVDFNIPAGMSVMPSAATEMTPSAQNSQAASSAEASMQSPDAALAQLLQQPPSTEPAPKNTIWMTAAKVITGILALAGLGFIAKAIFGNKELADASGAMVPSALMALVKSSDGDATTPAALVFANTPAGQTAREQYLKEPGPEAFSSVKQHVLGAMVLSTDLEQMGQMVAVDKITFPAAETAPEAPEETAPEEAAKALYEEPTAPPAPKPSSKSAKAKK